MTRVTRRLGPAGWSLRARLTAAATVALAALTLTGSALLVWRVHQGLYAGLDAAVTQRAHDLSGELDTGRAAPAATARISGGVAVQVLDPQGRVLASSPDLDGEPRLFHFPAGPAGAPRLRTIDGVPLGDEASYRVAAARAGNGDTVYVGVSTGEASRGVAELIGALGVGVPVTIGLLAACTWLLVGRALSPVETLRRQAAEITSTDLHRRLDIPGSADELRALAETVNDLLRRLEEAASMQRRFVADAAHELRSPLTSLRTQLDVAVRQPETTDWPAVAAGAGQDALRLGSLVDDLVALARLDAGGPLQRTEFDLDDVVLSEVERVRRRSEHHLEVRGVQPLRLCGDPAAWARICQNLLDNAVRHARSQVDVRLLRDGDGLRLEVRDDGPGIPPAARATVFERFRRLDEGRGQDAGGSGLGLAIVRELVAAQGGRVWVEDGGPGARLVVRAPA